MAVLSQPLMTQILSKLPVKSLLRFRCVSKSWKSLIDSPDFINLHLKQSLENTSNHTLMIKDCFIPEDNPNRNGRFLYSVDYPSLNRAISIDCPFKCDAVETEMVGSCNGLLCLADDKTMSVFLYNPATRKHRVLPVSGVDIPVYVALCDRIVYGFGYDHVNDDYKVVRIIQLYAKNSDLHKNEVKVYSLKANSWKRIQDLPLDYYLCYGQCWGAYVGGCFNWVVIRNPKSEGTRLIYSFDLGSEEFRLLPKPDCMAADAHLTIGVLGGCLRLLDIFENVRMDLWIMKEYGVKESWTKLFTFCQWESIGFFESVNPIAYSKSGSEVLIEQDFKKLVWCDLRRQRAKRVKILGIPETFDTKLIVETLVPLDNHKKKKKNKPKKKRNKQSEEPISELATLPTALLYNILSRLPAKTLLKFRIVCKAWNNLIHDPAFAKMHLEVSGKRSDNLNLIIGDKKLHLVDLDLLNKAVQMKYPLTCPEGWTDIIGSCNGLMCLSNQDKDIAVWNPLTGSCHKVPIAKFQSPKGSDVFQSFIYGFGYDPVSDDYKIVQNAQRYFNGYLNPRSDTDTFAGSEVQIYSLKKKCWRRIQCFPYIPCYSCPGILASGALYWVAQRRHDLDSTVYIIMAFDLGSEKCRELPQPNYDDIHFHLSLALLGGSLCIVCHYPKHGVDIWVMKDHAMQSWWKIISITHPKPIKYFEYIKPLVYSKNCTEVLLAVDYEYLIWYNLQKKTIRPVNVSDLPKSFDAEVFSGSLLDPENVGGIFEIVRRTLNEANNLSYKNHRNPIATFPEKLLCRLFSQLPLKTLLQVQLVCKTWYNLVNGQEFIKMHLEESSKSNNGLLLILGREKVCLVDFQRLDKAVEMKHPLLCQEGLSDIVGSSNGVLCLCKEKDFALWNPSTGRYERLPSADFQFSPASNAFHCLIRGFGYDPTSEDYKLVCILQQHSRLKGGRVQSEVLVYSLKGKSWRRIRHFPYIVCYPCSGVLASSALHWVARQNPELYCSSNLLIAFDLGLEKFRVVTQPSYVDTDFQMSLGLLRDCLCLLCHYPEQSMDMWVMTDYVTESWTKLISIKQGTVTNCFGYIKPLAYSDDGTEVLMEQDHEKFFWYNLRKKTVRHVYILGVPKSFETVVCSRSLVQIGSATRNYNLITEQPSKEIQSKRDKKARDDDTEGFLAKGFKLKL